MLIFLFFSMSENNFLNFFHQHESQLPNFLFTFPFLWKKKCLHWKKGNITKKIWQKERSLLVLIDRNLLRKIKLLLTEMQPRFFIVSLIDLMHLFVVFIFHDDRFFLSGSLIARILRCAGFKLQSLHITMHVHVNWAMLTETP